MTLSLDAYSKFLCYNHITFCFQKLEKLTWYPLTTSHTALQKFCEAMPHITKMDLSHAYHQTIYDGVFRAISNNMHHLKSLDVSNCFVNAEAIEYLLPTEDNAAVGCPELVDLNLRFLHRVDVELLKIILALPKLRSLRHGLLVNALGDLAEEDMGVDTVRHLNSLYAFRDFDLFNNHLDPMRYDILLKSPVFARFYSNIKTVDIQAHVVKEKQNKESALLSGVLLSLPKLRSIKLKNISEAHKNVLPLLSSIGVRVEYLHLSHLAGNLSVQDIMKTCPNLVELTLCNTRRHLENDLLRNSSNIHHDQVEWPKLSVLNCLAKIQLHCLNKGVCSAKMLIALLQSPCLNKINLLNLEVMSDDVMFNAFSSRDCAALSKVTEFMVKECPLITAEPFVCWLTRKNCSLQYIRFSKCEKIDYKIIKAAAEKCHRPLIIDHYDC